MTKQEAKRLSETISNIALQEMMIKARNNITDWTIRSKVNIGMTIGLSFNIYISVPLAYNTPNFVKANMMYEFGEYLDYERNKIEKKDLPKPAHENPKQIPENFLDPF